MAPLPASAVPPSLEARVAAVIMCRPGEGNLGQAAGGAGGSVGETASAPAERVHVADWLGVPVCHLRRPGSQEMGFTESEVADRAVLAQSSGNVAALQAAGLKLREPLAADAFAPGAFGENLFLDAPELHAGTLCVGDQLACVREGEVWSLRLQVVSPQCPCATVDEMLGKTYTADGVRAHCARTGQAGFFLRVLRHGDVKEGDVLKVVARPNPSWTLARVSELLYGHPTAVMSYPRRTKDANIDKTTDVVPREEWMGTEQELRELASLPELAAIEWKENLHKMLGLPGVGRFRAQSPGSKPPTGSLASWFLIGPAILLPAACVLVMLSRRAR